MFGPQPGASGASRFRKPGPNETVLVVTQETVNGRAWTMLKMGSSALAINWTYDRGYLIASADRGLATRAIAVRDSSGWCDVDC